MAYGDRIAYEETLEKALDALFGKKIKPEEERPQVPELEDQDIKSIILNANDVFNKAQQAQKEGKWADYGKQIEKLKSLLQKLKNESL